MDSRDLLSTIFAHYGVIETLRDEKTVQGATVVNNA